MYRADEPAFCRSCGSAWTAGSRACASCGEPLEAVAETATPRPTFRDQSPRVRRVGIALTVSAIAAAAAAWTDYDQLDFIDRALSGAPIDLEAGTASDNRFFALGAVNLLAFGACAAFFLSWLFEAGRNLRALGRQGLRFAEEKRVLWFFIPVAHLVMPLLGLRELYKASCGPAQGDWRTQAFPAIFGVWWLVWLISNLSGDVAAWYFFGDRGFELDPLVFAQRLDLLGNLTRIAAAPLAFLFVRQVHAGQLRLAAQLPGVKRA